jgi:outer membrane protein assembly factor BamB
VAGDEPREQDQLRRFWDGVVQGAPGAPDGLDPSLAETVRRLHALNDLPWPDPGFAERTWRRLQSDLGTASIVVVPTPGVTTPNGRPRNEDRRPSDPTAFADRPRGRPIASTSSWARFRRLRPLLELMAAVLILGLESGYVTVSWLQPQVAIRWQHAAVLEAPSSVGVPMFRGNPARTGAMPGPGPAAQPHVLWRLSPPPAAWRLYDSVYHPSPAIANGVVYLGHPDGTVSAVDAVAGTTRWQVLTGGAVAATPAVVYGMVYISSSDGYLYALDAATGAERWRREIGPVWASPVVVDDIIYVTTGEAHAAPAVDSQTVYVGGGFGTDLVAVDAATGEERWRFPLQVAGLYAVDAASGQQHWHVPTQRGVNSAPAVADGMVYVGDFDHRLYAVDAASGDERWSVQVGEDSNRSETRDAIRTPDPAPAAARGVVYAGGGDGTLAALDGATGTERWHKRLGSGFVSAPGVASGVVYIGHLDGTLEAVDSATGEELWAHRVDGPIGGPPAVVDGVVYVATTVGALFALTD